MKFLKMAGFASILLLLCVISNVKAQTLNILIFTKVEQAFRHDAAEIEGINAIEDIARTQGWNVDQTTNSNSFTNANLAQYDAVIFNNNLGDVLNNTQQNAFEAYINNGGGYVGIHAAGATETGWPWYVDMIGTSFDGHPRGTPRATLNAETTAHISTSHLNQPWTINEEWYNWTSNPREESGVQVLLTVDESTYQGGTLGDDHPISWCREYDGGRMWYTALGHNPAHFSSSEFRDHITGGIRWVANPKVVQNNLLLDLDANSGVTANRANLVSSWRNKVSTSPAQDFVSNDIGRAVAGSGRPTLREGVDAISGRNTLVFNEDELINFNENAFDGLIQGSGYTWLAVVSPEEQQTDNDDNLVDINAFFGNLRNSNPFDGIWGAFEDDNSVWMGSRNGRGGPRNSLNNPHAIGDRLNSGQYYIVAGRQAAGQGTVALELFVNDASTPQATAQFPVNPDTDSSKMAIGTERDAVQHPGRESFDGSLARFLIYDRPLSNTELQQTINALDGTYNLGVASVTTQPEPGTATNFNFESGDLQGATISSGAFSEIVTDLENFNHRSLSGVPYNKEGTYFLSTLETINGRRSDSYMGVVTSPRIVLSEPNASLLVGGGDSDRTYFAIYLDNGREIYRTQGSRNEPLELRTIDLSSYVGQTVYWQVVDLSADSWGYLAVDDIRFTNAQLDPSQSRETVFDFETGDLQGASVTSGSFSEIVTDLENFNHRAFSHLPYNKQGTYFLSTLETINGRRSDSYTGVITSDSFRLTTENASLLIGGGDSSETYFAVCLANGTEIYRTQGSRSEPLESRTVDLSAYVGQTVYWKVVDLSTSSWGYIAVDDIRFNIQ